MKKVKIEAEFDLHDDYTSFSEAQKQLFQRAKDACLNAYAPYSNFQVGAVVLMRNGNIYEGNNQENAAFPSGLCAERSALYYAAAVNPNVPVDAIAVTVNYAGTTFADIVSPCGSCRQAIAEYEQKYGSPITIYLLGPDEKVCVVHSIRDLLPLLFSGEVLKEFRK